MQYEAGSHGLETDSLAGTGRLSACVYSSLCDRSRSHYWLLLNRHAGNQMKNRKITYMLHAGNQHPIGSWSQLLRALICVFWPGGGSPPVGTQYHRLGGRRTAGLKEKIRMCTLLKAGHRWLLYCYCILLSESFPTVPFNIFGSEFVWFSKHWDKDWNLDV